MKISIILTITLALGLCAFPAAHAAVVITAPTASTAGSFTITDPITFTINTTADAFAFVFDEYVTSDGAPNGSAFTPNLSFSLNGGAAMSTSGNFRDNFVSNAGAITPNDGLLLINAFTVAFGDTVTLNAGTYSLGAASGFNPQATQSFTGNMFIASATGSRISDNVAVPEPGTYVLLGISACGLGLVLRRRKRVG